jgi:hypothetical protein
MDGSMGFFYSVFYWPKDFARVHDVMGIEDRFDLFLKLDKVRRLLQS